MTGNRKETRRMGKLRAEFFQAGLEASLSNDPEIQAASNCWICTLPINYDVAPSSSPDSHNLDHYYSVEEHPEMQEDPANFRHSHMLCNIKRGKGILDGGGLGEPVPAWWPNGLNLTPQPISE